MSFGDRLRELRENKGSHRKNSGKSINQKKANISKYETGKLQPSLETIDYLADFFGVSTDYLLGRTEETVAVIKKESPGYD